MDEDDDFAGRTIRHELLKSFRRILERPGAIHERSDYAAVEQFGHLFQLPLTIVSRNVLVRAGRTSQPCRPRHDREALVQEAKCTASAAWTCWDGCADVEIGTLGGQETWASAVQRYSVYTIKDDVERSLAELFLERGGQIVGAVCRGCQSASVR